MKRMLLTLTVGFVLFTGVAATVSADDAQMLPQFIDQYNIHRIAGFATLGLATTTGILRLLNLPVHPAFGYATAGFAVATVTLGTIAYSDRMSYAWPHVVMNSLATVGFLLNAFVFPGGSPAHIVTGALSIGLMYAAVTYIIIVTHPPAQ